MVPQDIVLFNDTIAGNIAYGALEGIDRDAIIRAATAAHAMEFIEQRFKQTKNNEEFLLTMNQ